jgi:hypothetical protein
MFVENYLIKLSSLCPSDEGKEPISKMEASMVPILLHTVIVCSWGERYLGCKSELFILYGIIPSADSM